MEATFPDLNIQIRKEGRAPVPMGRLSAPAALHPVPLGVHGACRRAPTKYQAPLPLGLRLPAVPRLVLGGVLCHTYFRTVLTQRLADEDAQVHDENVFIDLKRRTVVEAERLLPQDPCWASDARVSTRADWSNTARVSRGTPAAPDRP